jgi:GxxExxY protein
MAVHRALGAGFSEAAYQEALGYELFDCGIPFLAQIRLPIRFKERILQTHFRADYLCYDDVVVELKALRELGGAEEAQILNYLKASGKSRGLLLNFGTPSLTYRRFIYHRSHRLPQIAPISSAQSQSAQSIESA